MELKLEDGGIFSEKSQASINPLDSQVCFLGQDLRKSPALLFLHALHSTPVTQLPILGCPAGHLLVQSLDPQGSTKESVCPCLQEATSCQFGKQAE